MNIRSLSLIIALLVGMLPSSAAAQGPYSMLEFVDIVGAFTPTPEIVGLFPFDGMVIPGAPPRSMVTTAQATGDYVAAYVESLDPMGRVIRRCAYLPLPYPKGRIVYRSAIPVICWTRLTSAGGQVYKTRYVGFGDTSIRTRVESYTLQGFLQIEPLNTTRNHAPLYGMEDPNSDGDIDVSEVSDVVLGLPLETLGFTFKRVAQEYEDELDLPTYLQQVGSGLPPSLLDLWSGVLVKPDWFDDAANAVIASVLDGTHPDDLPEVDAKLDVVRIAKKAYRNAFDLDAFGLIGENCDALIWRESLDYVFEPGVHYCVPADSAFVLSGKPKFEDGVRLTVAPSAVPFEVAAGTEFYLGKRVDLVFRRPIVAEGTAGAPIRFKRLHTSERWGSVSLEADGNLLEYVVFDGGTDNLTVRSQNNTFEHLTSKDGVVGVQANAYTVCSPPGGPPGTCFVKQSGFTLTNSIIQSNLYEGIQRINFGPYGTVGVPATASITSTEIIGNGGDGILVAGGAAESGGIVTVAGGTEVRFNGGSGITAVAAEVVIAGAQTLVDDNEGSGIEASSSAEVYVTEAKIQNNTEYGVRADYYSEVTFAPPGGGVPPDNATVQGNLLGGLFAEDHASINAGTFAKSTCASACNNSILQSTGNAGFDVKAAGSSTVLAQFDWWGPGVAGAGDLVLVDEKGSFIEVEPVRTTPPGGGVIAGNRSAPTAGRSADSLRVMLIEARAAAAEADYTEAFQLLRDVIRDGDADFRRLAYTEVTRLLRQARPAGAMSYLEGIARGTSAYRPWALRALVIAYGAEERAADAEAAAATLIDEFGGTRHALFGHLNRFHLRLRAGNLPGAEVALDAALAGWPEHQAVIAAAQVLALLQRDEGERLVGGNAGMAQATSEGATARAKHGDDETATEAFALGAAYPNPARGRITVPVVLPEASRLRVTLHDVLGREVAVLADGMHAAGRHALRLDAALPAGLYLVRAAAEGATATQKLVLMR